MGCQIKLPASPRLDAGVHKTEREKHKGLSRSRGGGITEATLLKPKG